MNNPLLDITDLRVYFHSVHGEYKVVDGVDLSVYDGEILGLAGESGCGKSTVVEAIMRLIRPPGYIESGKIIFNPRVEADGGGDARTGWYLEQQLTGGVDLVTLPDNLLRQVRWKYISYIPQASMNSLNPIMKVETQMIDVIRAHADLTEAEARARAAEVLAVAGLPEQVLQAYPHELSGGMKQRVCIANAVTLNPQLIIADEPTTALDVNVQRAILEAFLDIRERFHSTILFVSHDLAVHAQIVDRVAIMYAGKLVEIEEVHKLFKNPLHPYSERLFGSIPVLGSQRVRLESILGQAPDRLNWPSGCRFHPRCPRAMKICSEVEPPLVEIEAGHRVACHLYYDVSASAVKGDSSVFSGDREHANP